MIAVLIINEMGGGGELPKRELMFHLLAASVFCTCIKKHTNGLSHSGTEAGWFPCVSNRSVILTVFFGIIILASRISES
jgi:hypothetical protein